MNKRCVNGVTYAYRKEGQGPVLLLLHGFTGSKETWTPFLQKWSKEYTVLAVDIIGHGESDAPLDYHRYEMKRVVEDLFLLLKEEQIYSAYVLGYSMGGRVAIAFAAAYPHLVKGLILESCTAGLEEAERQQRVQQDEALASFILQKGIVAFVDKWENIPLFIPLQQRLSSEGKKKLRLQRLQNSEIGLSNSLRGMGTGTQDSYWEKLKTFSFPVLLLCGEEDTKFCTIMKRMHYFLENSNYIKFSYASHAIHVEDSKNFGTIVSEHLIKWDKGGKEDGNSMGN